MNKRTTGTLIALAYVLQEAAAKFAAQEIGTYKLRRSAGVVMRAAVKAIGVIGKDVIVDKGPHREVSDALKRQAQRTLDDFVAVATLHMQRRQLYCPEFVCARIMGCHLAIDHLIRKHNAPKEWRKLEAVTATMLSMLLVDLGEEEALMYRVAEGFEERCAA
jgi:hypothetical protein